MAPIAAILFPLIRMSTPESSPKLGSMVTAWATLRRKISPTDNSVTDNGYGFPGSLSISFGPLMKPAPFEYFDPETIDSALDALADAGDGAVVIAGGQSLVPLLNLRLARPDLVIDPRRISSLHELSVDGSELRAGALVTATRLLSDVRARALPGLSAALAHVGHVQIRNRTTIGGSLAHADPAAELPAWLVACEGSVVLQSRSRGTRVVSAADLFVGSFTTSRQPDELLTEVRVPCFGGPMTVLEVARRPGDFAMAGVVAGVAGADCRVVAFGVGPKPLRLPNAEAILRERGTGHDSIRAAGDAARAEVSPSDDIHGSAEYRRHVVGTLVTRALAELEGAL